MQAQIIQILGAPDYAQEVQRAAELLSAGKLLVLPTETVYGVAGVLSDPQAHAHLTELRHSTAARPFTVHVARPEDALRYLDRINDFARRALRKLWPGPIGLIFDVPQARRRQVAKNLAVAEEDLYDGSSIALRCPDHPVFVDVVGRVKEPVALTSAGHSIQRISDLPEEILSRVETVFDAGHPRFSKPSTLVRIKEDSYEIARAGVYDERIIDRLLRTTFLFVCSGNTCRSPMAEAIARRYLAERLSVSPENLEKRGISVMSAGSFAMPGSPAAQPAVETLRAMGLDLSRHRSRPLSVELIHQADFIYTMSQSHAQAVASLVPAAAAKVSALDPDRDIEDPIGGDLSLYTKVADQLKTLIEKRLAQTVVP
ncbi:MAG TPA: Sua5/YciO/YrdC/YwlC family protein [Tepidisphaeraceae bacterium]|jgi:protein-tyrosine phosphatase|nr:Sua5/YciO/YrdC/YwlC family protein [Tepidisphaeraceae bacterium]